MSGISNASGGSKPPTKPKLSPASKEPLSAARKPAGHEKEIGSLDQILDIKKEMERNLKLKVEEVRTKEEGIKSLRLAKEKEVVTLRSAKNRKTVMLQSDKDEEIAELKWEKTHFLTNFKRYTRREIWE